MYSKSLGSTDRHMRMDARPAGGMREPAYRRVVRVPPNYSGHAFRDGEERPLGQPTGSASFDEPRRDRPPHGEELPTPRFDDLPRVSTLGHREGVRPVPPAVEDFARSEGGIPCAHEEAHELPPCEPTGLPVPLDGEGAHDGRAIGGEGEHGATRGLMGHFPFGHGLGFEELLLLGLMLVLLREGDGDGDLGETLVLLGVLLLCG